MHDLAAACHELLTSAPEQAAAAGEGHGRDLWLHVQLKRIDRKLKQCRNWAVDPKSEAFQASQALGQQQQAAQRANKVSSTPHVRTCPCTWHMPRLVAIKAPCMAVWYTIPDCAACARHERAHAARYQACVLSKDCMLQAAMLAVKST